MICIRDQTYDLLRERSRRIVPCHIWHRDMRYHDRMLSNLRSSLKRQQLAALDLFQRAIALGKTSVAVLGGITVAWEVLKGRDNTSICDPLAC